MSRGVCERRLSNLLRYVWPHSHVTFPRIDPRCRFHAIVRLLKKSADASSSLFLFSRKFCIFLSFYTFQLKIFYFIYAICLLCFYVTLSFPCFFLSLVPLSNFCRHCLFSFTFQFHFQFLPALTLLWSKPSAFVHGEGALSHLITLRLLYTLYLSIIMLHYERLITKQTNIGYLICDTAHVLLH